MLALVTVGLIDLHPTIHKTVYNSQIEVSHIESVILRSNPRVIETVTVFTQESAGPQTPRPKPSKPTRYLTIYPLDSTAGRLGNLCFRYAAAMGIAKANNMTLVLPNTPFVLETRKVFQISAPLITELSNVLPNFKNLSEKHWGIFDENLYNLPPDMNIQLHWSYTQSHKYFNLVNQEVHRELSFTDAAQKTVSSFMRETRERYKPDHIVGVHIRRGDFLSKSFQDWGYSVAPREFFTNATQYYIDKYGRNIVFVVASDDRYWCQHELDFHGITAKFVPGRSATEDLTLLVGCDHHIVSVGTFGWWSAWLGKGDVVYYKGFPRPGSSHAANHNAEDYYPSTWVGIG